MSRQHPDGKTDGSKVSCSLCELTSRHVTRGLCPWCASTRSPHPIATHMNDARGALARLAAATGIDRAVLRRASTGDGPLSLAQAVLVARELGCRPENLDLETAAARARARRAASKAVTS